MEMKEKEARGRGQGIKGNNQGGKRSYLKGWTA